MAVVLEVEHILGRTTPEAFATFEKHYGELSIPILSAADCEVHGAWRQVTGDVARDLMLLGFDSLGAYEVFQAALASEAATLMKLGAALAEAKLRLGEVTHFCSVLPIAEGRQALGHRAPGKKPRRYCRVRRTLPLANIATAAAALAELANAQDKNGKARLFTAYDRFSDRMLTEIWVLEDDRLDPYADAPIELLATLDALTSSVSTTLLEPFSYSEAR